MIRYNGLGDIGYISYVTVFKLFTFFVFYFLGFLSVPQVSRKISGGQLRLILGLSLSNLQSRDTIDSRLMDTQRYTVIGRRSLRRVIHCTCVGFSLFWPLDFYKNSKKEHYYSPLCFNLYHHQFVGNKWELRDN